MSYDTKKIDLGREPFQVIELDSGWCENSFGVGAYWTKSGNEFEFGTTASAVSMAALNSTDIAYVDKGTHALRTYRFDGTDWAQVGNSFTMPGIWAGYTSTAALNSTDIAHWDNDTDNLVTYDFDGSDWAQVGNALSLGSSSNARLAALNTTDIAAVNSGNNTLRTYRFDGADWSQVGNSLSLGSIGISAIAALSSGTVAVVDDTTAYLRTYEFDGTDWAQVGNNLDLTSIGQPSMAALNSTDIVLAENVSDAIRQYRFDGADWTQIGAATDLVAVDRAALCALTAELISYSKDTDDIIQAYAYISQNCEASGAAGTECHNTRASCQDPDNYGEITKTYRFCQSRSNLPVGINMIPSVSGSVRRAPTTTTAGKGLGNRAVVKVRLNDHTWGDHDTDPYVNTRTYTPEETGTYWGKWLARNPYFEGREMRVLTGYMDVPFSWDNFQTEYYDIADIAGPNNGEVMITGKDILARTYERKAKYPVASTGVLDGDITAGASSATLSPAGIGNEEYPASGTLAIGKEAITFTRSGDTLTLTARAQWGTDADAHSEGDTVQVCAAWTDEHVLDVLKELLTDGAGIPDAYIPDGAGENWTTERAAWMQTTTVTGILMKPEGVEKVISELSQQNLFDIWWSAVDQEIKIKALSPNLGGGNTLTDDYHILEDSLSIKKDSKQRISEVQVFYGKLNHAEKDEPTEFRSLHISTDLSASGSTKYGSESIMTIYSRWITEKGRAAGLAGRLLARFVDTPSIVSFSVDMKDEGLVDMAEQVILDTNKIQGFTGANEPTSVQITKLEESEIGSTIKLEALSSSFSGRYFVIGPNSLPTYSSATTEQKESYGFLSYNTGDFLDGEDAYKII